MNRLQALHDAGVRSGSRDPSPGDRAGVDVAAITAALEREGVRSFCDSYGQLLQCIEAKKAQIAMGSRPPAIGH